MKISRFLIAFLAQILVVGFFAMPNAHAQNTDEIVELTGDNANLNFSIPASILQKNNLKNISINLRQWKISGSFYMKGVGFVTFTWKWSKTCQANGECHFVNFPAHNPLIGNVKITMVINKNSRQVRWEVTSGMGKMGLENIVVKNSSTHLAGLENLVANHETELKIENPEAQKLYELQVICNNVPIQTIIAKNQKFSKVDLSLAGKYDFHLIVKNANNITEKTIKSENIAVHPGKIAKDVLNIEFFAKKYCQTNHCVDGNIRKWSQLIYSPEKIFPGNTVNAEFLLRDQYGNAISGKSLKAEFKNTLKTMQVDTRQVNFTSQNGIKEVQPAIFWNNSGEKLSGVMSLSNVYKFTFKPIAPTNNENSFVLTKLSYDDEDIFSKISQSPFVVEKPYEIEAQLPTKVYSTMNIPLQVNTKKIGTHAISSAQIIGKITTNPQISSLQVNSNGMSCHKNLLGALNGGNAFCNGNISDNFAIFGYNFAAGKKIIFKPIITNQKTEATLSLAIGYTILWEKVIYEAFSKNFSIEEINPKDLEITGGIHNSTTENSSENTINFRTGRNDLLNLIHKNIAYLGRNISDFSNQNYEVFERNVELSSHLSPQKRTYIAIGGDITIDQNINNTSDPIAIIALEKDGVGGNIIIKGSVTNLNTSLIAEKSILGDTNKKNQLYIKGSIMAENLCSGQAECFSNIRKEFRWDDPTSHKAVGQENNPNKIIVEYNPALRLNPPPGLENFAE